MWYRTASVLPLPRFLRVAMLIVSLLFFSAGAIVVVAVLGIFSLLTIRSPKRRELLFRKAVFQLWTEFIKLLQFGQIFGKIEVEGIENIPSEGKLLVIANHVSIVDVVVLGAQFRNFNCVVKARLLDVPVVGSIIRSCNFIPNQGGQEFIDQCSATFEENRPLIIFPQGTRAEDGDPIVFQRGAANIIARIDSVTVVPVVISTSISVFTKELGLFNVPKEIPNLHLQIQDPLSFERDDSETTTQVVKRVNKSLEELYHQFV